MKDKLKNGLSVVVRVLKALFIKENYMLSIYFGVPGSGKTTFAAYLAKKELKKKRKRREVYSNVSIKGTRILDPKNDIGKVMIENGLVIIDEAGIEYNNRDFKNFSKDSTYFFKYHRHYKTDVVIFSQGYDDMDKKLRTLAQRLYVVKKSLIPFMICRKRIAKRVGINDLTKEIIDEYYFVPFSTTRIFAPVLWKLFDSYNRAELPPKEWLYWGVELESDTDIAGDSVEADDIPVVV